MGNNENPKEQQRCRHGRRGRANNLQLLHVACGENRCNFPWNISVEQLETFLSI